MHKALIAVLLVHTTGACDPVDRLTVRIPTQPGDDVTLHWVKTYQGRTYVDSYRVAQEVARSAELVFTKQECCGTAAAYRDGSLRFLACKQGTNGEATLLCGKVGDAPAQYTQSRLAPQTCAELEAKLSSADLDPRTCTVTPRPAPPA